MGPGLECLAKVAVLGQALGNHYTNLDGWVSIKREHLSDNVVNDGRLGIRERLKSVWLGM